MPERSRTQAPNHLWVHFRIRDSYHPDPRSLLQELHGEDLLQGRLVQFARRPGSGPDDHDALFAVLQVDGIADLVFVPRDRIVGWVEDDSIR
jgi:hypothetical protein